MEIYSCARKFGHPYAAATLLATVGSKSIQPPLSLPLTAIVNKSCNIVCGVYNSNISNHPKYDFFKV